MPGAGAEPFPIGGIAAGLTLHHALQHRQRAAGRLPGGALRFPPGLLDSSADLGLHERRHGQREPILLRHGHRGDGPPWLERAAPRGAEPRVEGCLVGLAKGGRALRGWIVQQAPHDTAIPHGLAGAGALARLGKPATDLAHREAVASDPVKHWADEPGFVRDDLLPRLSTALVLREIPIPLGRSTPDSHGAGSGGMPLAAPVAFEHLRAFILRDHAWHWQQQVVFRAPAQRTVQTDDLHPGLPALLHHDHLGRVLPGQAIRRVDRQPIDRACSDDSTQALQPWASQGGSLVD